jgi:hypothetical protein
MFFFPHSVIFKNYGHFYARSSAGKYHLDTTELRTAFQLSGTTVERIRSFRTERLSRVETNEDIPVLLDEQVPKLVLHIIPFTAFSTLVSLDLKVLNDSMNTRGQLLRPLIVWDLEPSVRVRFNIDGLVRSNYGPIHSNEAMNSVHTFGYTQIFRNGVIEAVDLSILGVNSWNILQSGSDVNSKSFPGELFEKRLFESVKRYIEVEKLLSVDAPFFVMVSLLNVKGYKIYHELFEKRSLSRFSDEIDRTNLIIPEVIINTFGENLAEVMRPIFDTVWNAAGFIASPEYDASGKFKFDY